MVGQAFIIASSSVERNMAISMSGANQYRKAESALICEPMVSSHWAGIAVRFLEQNTAMSVSVFMVFG